MNLSSSCAQDVASISAAQSGSGCWAVAGRRIDQSGTACKQQPQHLQQVAHLGAVGIDVEGTRGAQADHRQGLAAGRNGAPDQTVGGE